MFKFISNLIKYRKREFDRVQITDATMLSASELKDKSEDYKQLI